MSNILAISKRWSPKRLISGDGLRAQLVLGGIGSGAVKAVGTLLSLAVALALARILGPEGYGVYSYVVALVTVLNIPAHLGLPQLVVRETARAQSSADWPALKGMWRWASSIAVASSLLLAVAGGTAAWLLADRFTEAQLSTFAWGLALVPLLVMVRLCDAALQGLRHVVAGQVPDQVLRRGLVVIVLVLALSFGAGGILTADRAMALHVIAAASAFAAGAVLLRRVRAPEIGSASPRYEHGAWARAVIPLGLTAGMMLINRHADVVLLGLFVEAEQVGVYRVAVQAAMLVAFGLQTVNLVVGPYITRMNNRGDHRQLQRLAAGAAQAALAVALPAALVFILFGDTMLELIVGADYVGGASALAILAVGQLVYAGTGPVGQLLNMTDYERVLTRTVASAAVGNILANLALIPLWGMNGAAVATAATFVVWNVLLARAVKKRLGINSTAFTLVPR